MASSNFLRKDGSGALYGVNTQWLDSGALPTVSMAPISVIIPALNEGKRIGAQVRSVLAQSGFSEVIVVDGGSDDDTVAQAKAAGAAVLHSPRGRARQMNMGAAAAREQLLFFLHADVTIPEGAAAHIHQTLTADAIAGVFSTWHIQDPLAEGTWPLYGVLQLSDLRSRVASHPYGDQGLFLRRRVFEKLGGFPDIPIMEDFAFSHTLARAGRIAVAPASVKVSGRRWQRHPFFTTFVMNTFPMAFRLGVSPSRLARLYAAIR